MNSRREGGEGGSRGVSTSLAFHVSISSRLKQPRKEGCGRGVAPFDKHGAIQDEFFNFVNSQFSIVKTIV